MRQHYSYQELVGALRDVGLKPGDIVFTHSNIGLFGFPDTGSSEQQIFETFLKAFQEVLGPMGTLVVPTFTYSFGRRATFDPKNTPSQMGVFAESIRKMPNSFRSDDPMFSVCAIGERADEMTRDVAEECFGRDSFWERFHNAGGKICNLGVFGGASTFFHYVERELKVPYRYNKLFPGLICKEGSCTPKTIVFFCQDMTSVETQVNIDDFNRIGIEKGIIKAKKIGRSMVCYITAEDTFELIKETIKEHPYFLIKAFKDNKVPVLIKRDSPPTKRSLPANSDIAEMIAAVWDLPRDIVSDGFDDSLQILSSQIPLTIHEYSTGAAFSNHIIPEKWICKEAYLETLNGERIFSYNDNNLHVASYSQAFNSIISREELFSHLSIHPALNDAIPFVNIITERDWRLCCSKATKDDLNDLEYRVVIKTEFSYGNLKVGESFIQGKEKDCIVFYTHLDGTNQANNGLSGVVAGIDVMRYLNRQEDLQYSYRLLIGPENMGADLYFSNNPTNTSDVKAILYLNMLGLKNEQYIQFLGQENSHFYIDAVKIWGRENVVPPAAVLNRHHMINQLSASGLVPVGLLSRADRSAKGDPYPEYCSNADNYHLCDINMLEDSVNAIIELTRLFETMASSTSN